jgi:hypothetical protein
MVAVGKIVPVNRNQDFGKKRPMFPCEHHRFKIIRQRAMLIQKKWARTNSIVAQAAHQQQQ